VRVPLPREYLQNVQNEQKRQRRLCVWDFAVTPNLLARFAKSQVLPLICPVLFFPLQQFTVNWPAASIRTVFIELVWVIIAVIGGLTR